MSQQAHTHSRLAPAAAGRPLPLRQFTSQCAGCEREGRSPLPRAPQGWSVEVIGASEYAFCPDCSIDLPGAPAQGGAQ